MICPINTEVDLPKYRTLVYSDLIGLKENLDVKAYMKQMYNTVYDATADEALALDYARLVPSTIDRIRAIDTNLGKKLRKENGLNLDTLADLVEDMADATQADLTKLNQEFRTDDKAPLAEADKGPQKKEEPKRTEEELNEAEKNEPKAPTTRLPLVQTIIDRARNLLRVRSYINFRPLTAFATRNIEKPTYGTRSAFEKEYATFVANAQRQLLFNVESQLQNDSNNKGLYINDKDGDVVGKVVLSLVTTKELIENKDGVYSNVLPQELKDIYIKTDPNLEGAVLVPTDEVGNPINFLEDGSPTFSSTNGKPVVFTLNTAKGLEKFSKEDKDSIAAIKEELTGANKQARAERIYVRQLQAIADARAYVKNNPGKIVQFDINGGSLGFLQLDATGTRVREPLSKLEEDLGTLEIVDEVSGFGENLGISVEKNMGIMWFSTEGMYGQPVFIERPTVEETGLAKMLTDLIVDDLVDNNGNKLTPQKRRELLDQYLNQDKGRVRISINNEDPSKYLIYLKNQKYEINSEADRENIRQLVNDFLLGRNKPTNPVYVPKGRTLEEVIKFKKSKGSKVVTDPAEGTFNDIYLDEASGIHYMIESTKLHPWKGGLNAEMQVVSITEKDGVKTLTTTNKNYKDFVKNNFYMGHRVNKDNKLQKTDPYLTFQLTTESQEEVYKEEIAAMKEPVTKEQAAELKKIKENHKEPDTSSDDFLEGLFKSSQEQGFDKRKNQQLGSLAATKKQIKEAKEWYEKSPISKFVSFEALFDVVNAGNPDSIARWSLAGITLYKGSDYSDLYHEAWHAFSQAFMTPAQRTELYRETRKKKGTFTDHTGKTVSFKKASDLQIEEYLAERFRGYMLNPGTKKVTAKERSLFKKILDFLREVFTGKAYEDFAADPMADAFVEEIFEKLRVGDITEYNFNVENTSFAALDKGGVLAFDNYEGTFQLNYENTMKMVDTIDSLLSEWIDLNNQQLSPKEQKRIADIDIELTSNTISDIKKLEALRAEKQALLTDINGNPKGTYVYTAGITKNKKFLENGYTYAAYRLGQIEKAKIIEYNSTDNVYDKEIIKKQLDLLKWSIDNFGDLTKLDSKKNKPGPNSRGLIAKHIEKSATFMDSSIVKTLDFEDVAEDDPSLGKQFDKNGNEQSMLELAKSEVVYLLKQIAKRDKNGKVVRNEFGIAETEEFSKMWNRLARTLQNTPNIEEMYIKLQEEATKFPQFNQLLNKMGPLQTNSLTSSGLWSNFFNTFGMARVPLIQVTVDRVVDKQGNVTYNQSTGEAFNADYAVGRSWQAAFTSSPSGFNKYIGKDKLGNYLNTDQILKDFNESNINNKGGFDFFNAIGFTLTDNEDIINALKENRGTYSPNMYLKEIKKLAGEGKKIRYYNQITDTLSGRYKSLQQLEAKFSDVFSNFMVTNAEGNTQFEHTLNNTLTILVNSINDAANYNDLISNPHLAHLDVTKNPFAESSVWLKSMFNLTGSSNPESSDYNANFGERRKFNGENITLEVVNLSGILLQENGEKAEEGIASAKADEFTKFIMDLHLGYNNYSELTRHADKGTSFAVRLNGPILNSGNLSDSYIPAYMFGETGQVNAMNKAYESVLPHIIAETKRIHIAKKALANGIQNTDFKYLKRGSDFITFEGYLAEDTKRILRTIADESLSTEDIQKKVNENTALRQAIHRDTTEYFNRTIGEVQDLFNEVDRFMSDNLVNDIINKGNANQIMMNKEGAKDAIVAASTVNTFLHHLESVSTLYGDLAQYKNADDFFKRNAGIGSTGRMYRTDSAMQELINNRLDETYEGKNLERLGIESARSYNGTFNTGILSDHEIGSVYYKELKKELKEAANAYEKDMNEADAQGLITFDAYRKLKIAEGSWSDPQQELYSKIINNEPFDPSEVTKHFPVIKAQYWGPLKTDLSELGLPINGFHKYSLFPMIPTVIKGKNMELMHDRMMQEGIDYMTFESGSKVGVITKTESGTKSLYKPGTRDLAIDTEYNPEKPFFTKNVIFLEYLKNQLDINDEPKGAVIFSTQFRKLVEDGLMEFGVPVDFDTSIKKPEDRIVAWARLETQEAKESASPYYKLIKEYESTIGKLVDIAKEGLLKEMNWTQDPVTGKLSGDKQNLLNFIQRELSRKELSDHELEFLNKGLDLSLSLNAQEIEKMMNALIVKRLVKQKVNGEALVQVATTLMENISSTQDRNYKNPTAEEKEKYGTNDLPSYRRGKNGETLAMKVKVALQGDFINLLELQHTDGNIIGDISRLNEMIQDEEWLNSDNNRKMITMTGVRIPVQGLNSMEFMEVYEFLPAEAGGIIVAPSEIVAKSGADFDVDKMTVMMPNISKKINRAKLSNKFLREMQTDNPGLDFSRDNVNMVLDFAKGTDGVYTLTDEDKQIIQILEDNITTEIVYNTGNNKKGLENELITNLINILQLPKNFIPLTTPNSTDIFTEKRGKEKSLSDELGSKTSRKYKPSKGSTRILEIPTNLKKHSENAVGKTTLGLGAVDNTYNTLFNRIGAYMSESVGDITAEEYIELNNKRNKTIEDKKALRSFRRQKLFLPHNKIGESISLSSLTDVEGNPISDVINQMINGWVDIAKDQWIFNIQGNKEIAPTLLFMIQAGVPVETAVYFVSNPIIRDYVTEQKKSKSTFSKAFKGDKAPSKPSYFRSQAQGNILKNSKYGFGLRAIKPSEVPGITKQLALENVNQNFDIKDLKESVNRTSGEYTATDRAAFLHFLEIEEMGKAVRDIKMKMNVDTSLDQSLYEAQSRIKMKDGLRADSRFPTFIIDNLINESPIGDFFVQPFQIELLGRLFPLRNHSAIDEFIDNIDLSSIQKGWPNRETFAADFKNDIVSFMLQNELNNFDVSNIESYKGLPIDTTVEEVSSLRYGAAVKNGKMYISKEDLAKQYKMLTTNQPTSLKDEYSKVGLQPVIKAMFPTEGQYVQFVLEREMIRSKTSLDSVKYDPQFKALLNVAKDIGIKEPNKRTAAAYESYLRNKALEKTYNNYHTFKGNYSYADQFMQIKQSYPTLAAEFSVFDAIEFSDSPLGFKNLKLNNTKLSADQKNVLFENIDNLSSKTYLQENFDSLTEADIDYISNFFNRFAMVAFLQSGLNNKSLYSLTSIVSSDQFINVVSPAYTKAMRALNSNTKSKKYLEKYLIKFLENTGLNARASKGRGKDFTINYSIDQEGSLEYSELSDLFNRLLFGRGFTNEGKYTEAENTYNPNGAGGVFDTQASIDDMKANPNNLYVYDGAMIVEGGTGSTPAAIANKKINDAALNNTVGLRTFNRYQVNPKAGGLQNNILKDSKDSKGNNIVNPDIAKKIDADIQAIIDNAKGKTIKFSDAGYGASLLSKDKDGNMFAPQTFIYLSKQLLENFDYINPGYLALDVSGSQPGMFQVQEAQQISDQEIKELNDQQVRDLQKLCKL